jgi:UDP-N-acetylglucosamine 2-epimerase (hydrolysing)
MVEDYGSTYLDIVRSNPKLRVFTRKTWIQGDSQIKNAIATVQATYELLQQSNCDLLIVHGDRLEAKAAADAAHLYGCRLGHVEGGDLTGGDDNKNRFAMTAVADYHFPSSQSAAERLLLTGQRAESIFTIGSPDLDIFFGESSVSLEEVMRKYNIPFADFGIAHFHPNSAESEAAGEQAKQLYRCLVASRRNFIVPRPNNDRGTEAVQAVIDSLPRDRFCVAPNFELDDYIVLIRAAGCVIGNSSVVVTAAPAVGKLCLNIGNRQRGRAPSIDGLFHFDPEDCQGILGCLETYWDMTYENKDYNGDGHAAERFLGALTSERFWQISQQKLLFDQEA